MARRVPHSERPPLFRDPADWARDWGWVSPGKAANDARALRELAHVMRNAAWDDEGVQEWAKEIERVANRIDPMKNGKEWRAREDRKVAAQREP